MGSSLLSRGEVRHDCCPWRLTDKEEWSATTLRMGTGMSGGLARVTPSKVMRNLADYLCVWGGRGNTGGPRGQRSRTHFCKFLKPFTSVGSSQWTGPTASPGPSKINTTLSTPTSPQRVQHILVSHSSFILVFPTKSGLPEGRQHTE